MSDIKYVDGQPVLVVGSDDTPTEDEDFDNTLVISLGIIQSVPSDSVTDEQYPSDEPKPKASAKASSSSSSSGSSSG